METEWSEHPTEKHLRAYRDGRVWSTISNKFLGTKSKKGRWSVGVSNNKDALRARVVYEAWYGVLSDAVRIDHIDGDPGNDDISNLKAYVTTKAKARGVTEVSTAPASVVAGSSADLAFEPAGEWRQHPVHTYLRAYADGRVWSTKSRKFIATLKPDVQRWFVNKFPRHRIVYEAWTNQVLAEGIQVDHIDGDATNDAFSNLQALNAADHTRKTVAEQIGPEGQARRAATISSSIKAINENTGEEREFPSMIEAARQLTGESSHSASISVAVSTGIVRQSGALAGWRFESADDTVEVLPGEVWKHINIDGLSIEVSSLGRVKHRNGGRISYGSERAGFMDVHFNIDKKMRHFKMHRLVAQAFLGPAPSKRHEIAHIDGNKLNNAASNLKWVTASQQMAQAIGRPVQALDAEGIVVGEYASIAEAARATGIQKANIGQVCRGHAKRSGGLRWRYADESDSNTPKAGDKRRRDGFEDEFEDDF